MTGPPRTRQSFHSSRPAAMWQAWSMAMNDLPAPEGPNSIIIASRCSHPLINQDRRRLLDELGRMDQEAWLGVGLQQACNVTAGAVVIIDITRVWDVYRAAASRLGRSLGSLGAGSRAVIIRYHYNLEQLSVSLPDPARQGGDGVSG